VKALCRSESIILCILNHDPGVVSLTLWQLCPPGKRIRYPLNRKLGSIIMIVTIINITIIIITVIIMSAVAATALSLWPKVEDQWVNVLLHIVKS
jgi:hypothetical protein